MDMYVTRKKLKTYGWM